MSRGEKKWIRYTLSTDGKLGVFAILCPGMSICKGISRRSFGKKPKRSIRKWYPVSLMSSGDKNHPFPPQADNIHSLQPFRHHKPFLSHSIPSCTLHGWDKNSKSLPSPITVCAPVSRRVNIRTTVLSLLTPCSQKRKETPCWHEALSFHGLKRKLTPKIADCFYERLRHRSQTMVNIPRYAAMENVTSLSSVFHRSIQWVELENPTTVLDSLKDSWQVGMSLRKLSDKSRTSFSLLTFSFSSYKVYLGAYKIKKKKNKFRNKVLRYEWSYAG